MKRGVHSTSPSLLMCLILISVLASVAACGEKNGAGAGSPTVLPYVSVGRNASVFTPSLLELGPGYFKQGRTIVRFFDGKGTTPAGMSLNGGPHVVCLGRQGQCSLDAQGPTELRQGGFAIDSGQIQDVAFSRPGVYQITAAGEQFAMLSITVEAPLQTPTLPR